MSYIDRIPNGADDLRAEIAELKRRLHDLETASPLGNSSMSSGAITLLVPGEGGGESEEVGKIGHAEGKIGFLVKEGGVWVTMQDWTGEKISVSHEIPNAKITTLEGKVSTNEGKLDTVDSRIASSHEYPNARITATEAWRNDAGPQITAAKSRADSAYDLAYNANSKAFTAQGRADSAYDLAYNANQAAAGKASASYVSSLNSRVNDLIDYADALEEYVRSQHPSKVPANPPVKG